MVKIMEESAGTCPVCRKVFLAKDIEHVLDLVGNGGNMVIKAFLLPSFFLLICKNNHMLFFNVRFFYEEKLIACVDYRTLMGLRLIKTSFNLNMKK